MVFSAAGNRMLLICFCCRKCFICQFSKIKILKLSMEHSRKVLKGGEGLVQVGCVLCWACV